MIPLLRFHSLVWLCVFCLSAGSALSESLEQRWRTELPKEISWYVRTSPGILLVKAGKSLTAVDATDGRQLWVLPDLGLNGLAEMGEVRGKNLLEIPGMGVLLLNRVKLAGDSEGRLIALNLMTGERLWDHPQVDELMSAIPLQGSRDVALVSVRVERKTLVRNLILTAGEGPPALIYPFRLEFQRMDPITGKTQWNAEYPRTFYPGRISVAASADHLFINYSNGIVGSIDLATGKQMWEEGSKTTGSNSPPLSLEMANGRLIYGVKSVRAVDPGTNQVGWEIDKLGKITGISLCDGVAVAVGDNNVAAVDAGSGTELWRKKTYGHGTNILWEKHSDAIAYVDGKGLHTVERRTGKSLLDARLQGEYHPIFIRLASHEVMVTIARDEVSAYNLQTGKKLFTGAKMVGFYPAYTFLNHWPMPDDGAELVPRGQKTPDTNADIVGEGSLLTGAALRRVEGYRTAVEVSLDAYETEDDAGVRTIWWIDAETNRRVEIDVTDAQHDVSRQLGMIFAVNKNQIWGAAITAK
jgi:outer membrane protein assembly factor BamB